MSEFLERSLAGALHLTSPILEERGIQHGFLGKPLNFIKDFRIESARTLRTALKASAVAMLNQVHGTTLVELPPAIGEDPIAEADGVLFPLITPGRSVVVGVRTADCVPLLIVGEHWAAAVHAGWRGLAQGIVAKAASELRRRDPDGEFLALIGPCAGRERYEVGQEVITAIGPTAVATELQAGKFLLDLTATTAKQLNSRGVRHISSTGVCTISDGRFHSFRRDRENTGNSLGFLVTAPA